MAMRLGTSTQLHSPTKKMSSLKERAGFHRGMQSMTWLSIRLEHIDKLSFNASHS